MNRIVVLRLGHRYFRDSRVTTHVCLTARAMGADHVIIADKNDKTIEMTVREIVEKFGGDFEIDSGPPWRRTIKTWKESGGLVVHLTAYGLPLPKVVDEIRKKGRDVLVVVGSEKMPGEVFRLADWNVSITNQPMSEVGALAIFLDWYTQHDAFGREFPNAQTRIIPSDTGKKIMQRERSLSPRTMTNPRPPLSR